MVWLLISPNGKFSCLAWGLKTLHFPFCAKLFSVLLSYPNCSFGGNKDMLECTCSATFCWNIMFTVKKKMPNSVLSQENSLLGSKLWLHHYSLILPKDNFFFLITEQRTIYWGWPKSWFGFFPKTLMSSLCSQALPVEFLECVHC